MGWCPDAASVGGLAIPANRRARFSRPTTCGRRTDYKGQFRTGDGRYCYPLTVADGFSRYLLGCQALSSTAVVTAKPVFTRLFQEYGLPTRIRSDNGVPFATNTLARLSTLSAWWVRLGIRPELVEPGHPEQNGRHERMHRTLKAETTRPAAGSLAAQQAPVQHLSDGVQRGAPARGDCPQRWCSIATKARADGVNTASR